MADQVIVLQAPSGRQYRTTDEAEAQHLQNTAGYRRTTAYAAETDTNREPVPTKRREPSANKARTPETPSA